MRPLLIFALRQAQGPLGRKKNRFFFGFYLYLH